MKHQKTSQCQIIILQSWLESAYLPSFFSQILDVIELLSFHFILIYFEWCDPENQ